MTLAQRVRAQGRDGLRLVSSSACHEIFKHEAHEAKWKSLIENKQNKKAGEFSQITTCRSQHLH